MKILFRNENDLHLGKMQTFVLFEFIDNLVHSIDQSVPELT